MKVYCWHLDTDTTHSARLCRTDFTTEEHQETGKGGDYTLRGKKRQDPASVGTYIQHMSFIKKKHPPAQLGSIVACTTWCNKGSILQMLHTAVTLVDGRFDAALTYIFYVMFWHNCAYGFVRFRAKKQLVRVRKYSYFGWKYLFWSPQTQPEMSRADCTSFRGFLPEVVWSKYTNVEGQPRTGLTWSAAFSLSNDPLRLLTWKSNHKQHELEMSIRNVRYEKYKREGIHSNISFLATRLGIFPSVAG